MGRPHNRHPARAGTSDPLTARWYSVLPTIREEGVTGSETIRYAVSDGIARITLARPQRRNALDRQMFEELGGAADRAARDPDVRAVIVVGDGPSFCAGIDLHLLAELAPIATDDLDGPSALRTFIATIQRPFQLLALMPKPTIAAVQGHALGAGFQLALACDLRVATGDSTFAILEPRYGLIPDLGGMHHLAHLIGPARAKELVWSTRSVQADEAEHIGLVNRVVAASELDVAATELARAVSAHSPTVLALTKSLIGGAHRTSLTQELELEAEAQAEAILGGKKGNATS